MTASVTDLRRKTSDLIDAVKRGESVEIESHGKPVATMEPASCGVLASVLRDALARLEPDPETADEIQAHVDAIRKAVR
jgi:prevent-host-death family protein